MVAPQDQAKPESAETSVAARLRLAVAAAVAAAAVNVAGRADRGLDFFRRADRPLRSPRPLGSTKRTGCKTAARTAPSADRQQWPKRSTKKKRHHQV